MLAPLERFDERGSVLLSRESINNHSDVNPRAHLRARPHGISVNRLKFLALGIDDGNRCQD